MLVAQKLHQMVLAVLARYWDCQVSEKDCQWRRESEINHHDNYEVLKVQFGVLFMQVLNFVYLKRGG